MILKTVDSLNEVAFGYQYIEFNGIISRHLENLMRTTIWFRAPLGR